MTSPIRYTIQAVHPAAHLFEVSLHLDDPDPAGQVLSLPAWIPGSYMIREFARNIVRFSAMAGGRTLEVRRHDKHTWQLPAGINGPVTVNYTVYARDLSVRTAHLDQTHGFFNGTSVFLCARGREGRAHLVDIRPPAGMEDAGWRVATSLPEAEGEDGAAERYGFGLYRAPDYDALIDHPVEMGRFNLAEFDACGVPHAVAITGRHDCDMLRLVEDLQPLCEAQIRLFGEPLRLPTGPLQADARLRVRALRTDAPDGQAWLTAEGQGMLDRLFDGRLAGLVAQIQSVLSKIGL